MNKEIIKLASEYPDIELSAWDINTYILLDRIIIPKQLRNQGLGTEVMTKVCNIADESGKLIVLEPDTSFGATSVARLIRFYKRFGFKVNKGRYKNFSFVEGMYRVPIKS